MNEIKNNNIIVNENNLWETDLPNDSFIKNCIVIPKENEKNTLFRVDSNGNLIVKLNGYAIISLKEYQKYIGVKI